MARRADWERRLAHWLEAHADARFAYGRMDCALFAAGAVEAMTGVDPAAAFRGAYRSAATSIRALKEIGAGSLEATVDSMFARIPAAFAQRGDLAMHDGSLGVVIGGDAVFVGGEAGLSGLVRIARRQWSASWRV